LVGDCGEALTLKVEKIVVEADVGDLGSGEDGDREDEADCGHGAVKPDVFDASEASDFDGGFFIENGTELLVERVLASAEEENREEC